MTEEQYYSLKVGDIVTWLDTGDKCIIIHFDELDFPKGNCGIPRQYPNKSESMCVMFMFSDDNYRVIGHRKEFGIFSQKSLNKTNNTIV